MRLAEILPREANNLDLFRILAAAMVIFGHAYALLPVAGQSDPLAQWLDFDSSSSLAVKVFFLLSALVIAWGAAWGRRARIPLIGHGGYGARGPATCGPDECVTAPA